MSELTWEERWKRINEIYEKNHRIDCPHCGEKQNIEADEWGDLITYHGEDDPVDMQCIYCEEIFFVKEHVDRTWKEGKTIEEALE